MLDKNFMDETPHKLPSPAAWAKFVQALETVAGVQLSAHWLKDEEALPSDVVQRTVGHALTSLLELLHSVPEIKSGNLHSPFMTLAAALSDVQNGRKSPLFQPFKNVSRLEIAIQFAMADAAIALDALIEAGMKREEAARKVAAKFQASKYPVRSALRTALWQSIQTWRDHLSEGPGGRAPQHTFEAWERYKQTREQFGATPEERAWTLLDRISPKRAEQLRALHPASA